MPEENEVRYYINEEFGDLFSGLIKSIGGNKKAAEKIYNSISLGKASLRGMISGYRKGNLLGNNPHRTQNSSEVWEHANKLSYILYYLEVPSDSEMIGLAKKTLGDHNFKYPPTDPFKKLQGKPTGSKHIHKH